MSEEHEAVRLPTKEELEAEVQASAEYRGARAIIDDLTQQVNKSEAAMNTLLMQYKNEKLHYGKIAKERKTAIAKANTIKKKVFTKMKDKAVAEARKKLGIKNIWKDPRYRKEIQVANLYSTTKKKRADIDGLLEE